LNKIAILGWGSLLWDPRSLSKHIGSWQNDGPLLPVEFSRFSAVRSNALTLVIDPEHGATVPVYYAISRRNDLQLAIQDLAFREGCAAKQIGFVDMELLKFWSLWDHIVHESILPWAKEKGLAGAIWTDLEPNFKSDSPKKALLYLQKLKKKGQECAYEYMSRAPDQIQTPFRDFISKSAWYKQMSNAFAEKNAYK